MLKHRVILFSYFFLMIAAFMVPSDGNHGLFTIKSMSFLAFAMLTVGYCFTTQRLSGKQLKFLLFMSISLIFLLFWFFVGLGLDQTPINMQIGQFKLFILTLSVPMMTLYLLDEWVLTTAAIFRCTIYASFSYIVLKITLIALHLLGIINIWDLLTALNFRYMNMNIIGGLERLQTSVDIATPFLLLFILQSDHLGVHFSKMMRSTYLTLALLSTFLSFSRYLIFVFALTYILYWLSLDGRRFKKNCLIVGMTILSVFFVVGPSDIGLIIEKRFFSKDNHLSDVTRVEQVEAMMDRFGQNPYFGAGVGGFAPNYIRDEGMLYLYEVQWVSFLMQFGIIGVIGLLIPLVIIAFKFINAPFSRVRYSFLLLFGVWVLSGFTNPFLISLTSGIMYTLFYLAGCNLQTEECLNLKTEV